MNPYLKNTLEFGPVVIARIADRVSPELLDRPLHEGRFTVREIIAHLADWEPILRQRIIDIRDHPGITVQVFDEGQMAIDHAYASQSIEEATSTFREERSITASVVRALDAQDMRKPYIHPERGEECLEDLVNSMLGHDLYHAEQISEYL